MLRNYAEDIGLCDMSLIKQLFASSHSHIQVSVLVITPNARSEVK